jgi:hypothetical protein
VNLAVLFTLHAAACPTASPVADAPGLPAVAQLSAAAAMRLNAEGKQLYRQERWDEARAKYRAALAADASLLGAALNVACSYSRQKHYAEAAAEAAKLIHQGYVPWQREVAEAADLGILADHAAAYAIVETARKEAALAWGERVSKGVLFVARTKPPLKLTGEGVLVLGLNQEIFAWLPETGRFFQVTAEDGRVLAFAVAADGRRIAYVLGGKVVRAAGQVGVLRGLSLRVLDLPTMSLGEPIAIAGEASRVELWFAAEPEVKITDGQGTSATWQLGARGLVANPEPAKPRRGSAVVLTARGIAPVFRHVARGKCRFSVYGIVDDAGGNRLEVARPGGKRFQLDTKYNAGLRGLPFPGEKTASPRPKN